MPGTGWQLVGTATPLDTNNPAGWYNPDHILIEDDVQYASTVISSASGTGNLSDELRATNFGFAVPEGATITGVGLQVRETRWGFGDGVGTEDAYLTLSGSKIGSDFWTRNGTTLSYQSLRTDEWGDAATILGGYALTPADVNDSTFGVNLQWFLDPNTTHSIYLRVAWVKMQIYYDLSGGLMLGANF